MKILFVTTISDTVNSFLIPHIQMLIQQGNEVGVAFKTNQEISDEIKLKCKVHNIDFQRNPLKKENLKAIRQIRKVIETESYELIHVHTPVASFITRFACRKMSTVKIIYTAHGFHFFKGSPLVNWLMYYHLEKIAARWTDSIITMNEEDFQSAQKMKLRNKGRVHKVHGVGINLNKFSAQTLERKLHLRNMHGYNVEQYILIYVGELSYRKHQDLLIKAISIAREKVPSCLLLLVGDGGLLNQYKKIVNKLQVDEHVHFLGYRKDVQELMGLSDLAISTSRQEGLPVNVMEAMATGLPIVVTDCRGNRDLITHGINGLVVDIEDPKICARAIEKIYLLDDLKQTFSMENRKLVKQYSLEKVLEEMNEIYKSYRKLTSDNK